MNNSLAWKILEELCPWILVLLLFMMVAMLIASCVCLVKSFFEKDNEK